MTLQRDVYWRVEKGNNYWNKVDDVLSELRLKFAGEDKQAAARLQGKYVVLSVFYHIFLILILGRLLRAMVKADRATFGVDDPARTVSESETAVTSTPENEIELEIREVIKQSNEAGMVIIAATGSGLSTNGQDDEDQAEPDHASNASSDASDGIDE